MTIVVQKFGGTSVSTEAGRLHCIKHIERELAAGRKVVAVVSAMGRKGDPYATDTLLSLLNLTEGKMNEREMDLYLSAGELISASVFSNHLFKEGIRNTILTGGQAGIITNDSFTDAKIISLQPTRLLEALEVNKVVVVTGFQGMTANGDTTTLGRGGSDTSATALGVALAADVVDIFTDVDGVYTADPRLVDDARALPTITYNEICNLAHLGAKVIHPRAVELAMQKNIPIRVRSTFSDHEGTLIASSSELKRTEKEVRERLITGITQTDGLSQLTVKPSPKTTAFPLDIFETMKELGISVDLINVSLEQATYTVQKDVRARAVTALTELGYEPIYTDGFAKVSVVGANMSGVPGVMAHILKALQREQIPIYQSADSHTTIWILVKERAMKSAVCALHRQFELNDSLSTLFQA